MEPLLSILVLTYNQEKFIAQAIDSILVQETGFDFEILIGDDCSTDNTGKIVKKYAEEHPDKIKLLSSSKNVGAIRNEKMLVENAKGKYLAFLEGDDFWNDPLKIQKQVGFLERHPDYGLVHGDVDHLFEESGVKVSAYNKTNSIQIPEGSIFQNLLAPAHLVKTMTTCFRKDLVDTYFDYKVALEKGWLLTDLPLWLDISMHSKVHYMDEVLATYRLSNESASRSQSTQKKLEFYKSVYDVFDHYTAKYKCSAAILAKIDEYKFKTLLKFSLLYSDARIIRSMVEKMKADKRRLNLKSAFIYTLVVNKPMFGFACRLYNTYRK